MTMISRAGYVDLLNQKKVPDQQVNIFHVPRGIHCTLYKENGAIILTNGKTDHTNVKFGKDLWDLGIRGDFIISHPVVQPQDLSRWLLCSINNDTNDLAHMIVIHILYQDGLAEKIASKPSKYRINIIMPVSENINEATKYNTTFNRDVEYDGIIFDFKDINDKKHRAHMFPVRATRATVTQVIYNDADKYPSKIMACITVNRQDHFVVIDRFSTRAMEHIVKKGIHVGDEIIMIYSSYIDGIRISNFITRQCNKIMGKKK